MDNRIREMDIDALFGLSKLHSLTLKRCHLRSMPPVAHVKDTLINLGVAQNLITHIPVDYFKGFVQLQTLFLSVNRLAQFPDVHPLNLTLNTLHLLSNRISLIPQSMIPSCSKLKQINIKRNRLVTLDGSLFVGRSVVMKVYMSDNPWICDSSLAWLCNLDYGNFTDDFLGRQLQIRMYGRAGFSDYNFLECAQPDLYAGVKIRDLSMLMDIQSFVHPQNTPKHPHPHTYS